MLAHHQFTALQSSCYQSTFFISSPCVGRSGLPGVPMV
uniref:Uncharacterized protein n=1 Tax=Arundo donax TaxID=35708 RepID=A0A0A9CEK2_ARUDO